jgi:hypothetical protein
LEHSSGFGEEGLVGWLRGWGGKQIAQRREGATPQTVSASCSYQDPLANVETLLWKHKRFKQGLEAQAEKIRSLEATVHSLHERGHPEAQSALARWQAVLLRYLPVALQ